MYIKKIKTISKSLWDKILLRTAVHASAMQAFMYTVARYQELKSPNQSFSVKRIHFLPGVLLIIFAIWQPCTRAGSLAEALYSMAKMWWNVSLTKTRLKRSDIYWSSPLGAKMGRGSPVCQQIREKIIEMFKNNVPQRKIGRDLDISPSTVHNIIKRFKESGGISVRKGQGRKPKLNNRDLRSLRRHCIKNRHSSISDITTWAQDYFGKPLSSTTIRIYIHKCQLKLYCAKRKPYVNSVQKRRRLLWARRHLGWTITQWKRVLWSDESVFQVFFGRNGRRVLRTKEEKDHPDCYQQQVQKPGSVMVWGCVSALGKGNLHFCDGTINAEKYIEILEHNMLPSRRHLFQGRPCIFQQDDAKPHSAHITKSWLRRKRVRVLDWPACSPDRSPIENVWRILKRKMRQRRPRTVAHLKTCLQEEWDKITPETLHHLVSSVPKRLLV